MILICLFNMFVKKVVLFFANSQKSNDLTLHAEVVQHQKSLEYKVLGVTALHITKIQVYWSL